MLSIFLLAQLIVNILWSAAFFGLRSPRAGVIAIAILLLLILATNNKVLGHFQGGSLIHGAFVIWVSFAAFISITLFSN